MTEPKRQVISHEIKAAALADLVFMEPAAVAAKYNLKVGTVYSWKSRDLPERIHELGSLASLKKQQIGALLLECLQANLNAQIAQSYVAADPEYIKRQPAGELAVLYGVLSDKSIRIVDASRALFSDEGEQSDDLHVG